MTLILSFSDYHQFFDAGVRPVPPLHESAILLPQVFQLGIGALDEAICRAHEADSVVQKKNVVRFLQSWRVSIWFL